MNERGIKFRGSPGGPVRTYRFAKAVGFRRYSVFMRLSWRHGRGCWDYIGTVFQLKSSPGTWHAIYAAKQGVNAMADSRDGAADILAAAYETRERG